MEKLNSHILIVDDEVDLCNALAANLKINGFRVTTFSNAKEAFQFLEAEVCDVILSDINMPGEDGISFLGRVHLRWPQIPFIIMTGFAELKTAIEAIKIGAFDFIQKPLNIEHLLKNLERALNYSRLLRLEENYKTDLLKIVEEERSKSLHLGRLSAIGEMAGGIAHEINNPLSIISTAAAIISKKIDAPNFNDEIPKIKESLEKIHHQVERMSKMVLGLRNFSRSGNNNIEDVITINKLFTSIHELSSEKLKMKNVKFSSSAHNLDLTFRCNLIQIEQVIVNLINNSVDAIAEQQERWIKLQAVHGDGILEFSLMDSGSGIPDELAEKIMQPFFTTKGMDKGTGLGLSISKGIIERHNGKFFLDQSSANTRFVIQIPIV